VAEAGVERARTLCCQWQLIPYWMEPNGCPFLNLSISSRRRLYPHLAKLVCSGQAGVRLALGHLMRQQLPPLMAAAT